MLYYRYIKALLFKGQVYKLVVVEADVKILLVQKAEYEFTLCNI